MESEAVLLPCLNRFCYQLIDHDGSGVLVYGSRQNIYFVDLRYCPPIILEDKVIYHAHRPRVTSVSLCKNKNNELLASVGEDFMLRIWDLSSHQTVAESKLLEFSHVVEWLSGSSNTVTFATERGGIIKWNFKENVRRRLETKCPNTVITIVSNPKSPELLAAGHSNGTISVIDVVKESLLHSYASHNKEITSLSWSPVSQNILLSASQDQALRLWKLGEDRPLFIYPTHPSQNKYDKKHKSEDKKYQKYFGICHPENEDEIIISSLRGEIGSVSFKGNAKFVPYLTKGGESASHALGMFLWNTEYQEKQMTILICADAFKISFWDISEKKLLYTLNLLLGDVLDLRASTVNPNLLAICTSDGFLKFWNLTSQTSKLDITSIYVYIKARIMTAAWHPVDENILAYSTNEGRVGIVDIFKKKSKYCFETQHKDAVYSLSWGPCLKSAKLEDSDNNKYFLYSCGAGTIFINKINDSRARALDFDDLVDIPADLERSEKCYSEVCWKSDYSYLAVCNRKGFVDLYNVDPVLLVRFDVKSKSIECLQWHPDCTYASPSGSPLNCWFAMSGIDRDIHIFDVKEISGKEAGLKLDRSTKKLSGHAKSVCSLSWSPHTDGLLASASRDGTVQIWNVLSSSPVANYQCHRDNVFAVHWSPYDPDVIFSGGQDSTVRIWKISQQTATFPPEKSLVKKKQRLKVRAPEMGERLENGISESPKNAPENCKAGHPSTTTETEKIILPEVKETPLEEQASSQSTEEKYFVTESKRKQKHSMHQKASLFSIEGISPDSKKNDIKNCMKLADIIADSSDSSKGVLDFLMGESSSTETNVMNFGLFTDQLTALKMIEIQSEKLKKLHSGNSMSNLTALSMMVSNTKKMLENADENGELSDFFIALAPSVSYAFWLEMCYKYAKQLSGQGLYAKASMYLISCGKIHEAVELLAEKENIINALALAKAYLPESDPLFRPLLFKCAKRFRLQQLFALEAMCFIAAKEIGRAAKVLYNTFEPAYIVGAAYVCKKFGYEENANLYNFLCLERCLIKCEWLSFKKLVKQEPRMKVYNAVVSVHENLCNHLKQIDKESKFMNSSVHTVSSRRVKFWEGATSLDFKKSFLGYIYDILMKERSLPPDGLLLEDMHEALLDMAEKRKNSELSSEAHISVAIFSTQYIILSLLGDSNLAEKYFIKIFEVCCNVPSLLPGVCSLFLPFDLYWCGETNTLLCERKQLDDGEEGFILQYKNICESFSKKMSGYVNSLDLSIVEEDLSNWPTIILKVKETLKCKKLEDILLPYFAWNLIGTLSELVLRNEYKFHYFNIDSHFELSKNIKDENTLMEPVTLQNGKRELNSNNNVPETVCDNKNDVQTEINDDEMVELISIALKEADEKVKLLKEAQNKEIGAFINSMQECLQPNSDFTVSSELVLDEDELKNENNSISTHSFSSTNPKKRKAGLVNETNQFIEVKIEHKLQSSDESSSVNNTEQARAKESESLVQLDGCSQADGKPEFQKEESESYELKNNRKDLKELLENELNEKNQHSTNISELVLTTVENALTQGNHENVSTIPKVGCEQIQIADLKCMSSNQQNHKENKEELVPRLHEQCFKDIEFINLLKLLTSMICKDEYALLHYIRERCTKLKLGVVSNGQNQNLNQSDSSKLPDVIENVESVEGMPSEQCLQTKAEQQSFSIDSENLTNDENSLNSNEETRHGAAMHSNNSDFSESQYEEIFYLLITKSKGAICPNTYAVVSEVIKIYCDVLQKIQHEDVKNAASAWLDELKLWNEKFCIKKKCDTVQCISEK